MADNLEPTDLPWNRDFYQSVLSSVFCWPTSLQKRVGDFCCINFGGFCRGLSWRTSLGTFSTETEEKETGDKIRPKIRATSLLELISGYRREICRRTLVIRTAAITSASCSATTIVRFCPSKPRSKELWLKEFLATLPGHRPFRAVSALRLSYCPFPEGPEQHLGNLENARRTACVKCRFSKCRFSVELLKLEKIFEMGGSVEK